MTQKIEIEPVVSKRDLHTFVRFPWKVYKGDPNWVPPLISERMKELNLEKNPSISRPYYALYLARKGGKPAGTIAAFIEQARVEHFHDKIGGFGFFEVIEDYQVASRLLEVACEKVQEWGMKGIRGPSNFSNLNEPGLLFEGYDSRPAMFESHNPPYYLQFVESFGMVKYLDLYAWRAYLPDLGIQLKNIPQQILRVFEAISKRGDVRIRKIRMENWDHEVALAHELFNTTLEQGPDHVPISLKAFQSLAEDMKFVLDTDLALFAETEGRTVGFIVALPDLNRVLHELNGRLFPLGWLKMLWHRRHIDQVTFKLFGVRKEYRRRGIDTLLYFEAIKNAAAKGYKWLDGSVTSEANLSVVQMAERLGAERYKSFRLYQMNF